ncbi:hypothetical protein [Marininema halotolerans]|uniref:DUF2642 domain-containing protein n=1 Tax=Marininema halotolerans TaxID=1155944 RepID=A0A1I6R9R3_9BACL|nr:hypothetical protein [Marininema halotolerans]SFS61442.1 hypothetical protein SAMN05444972_104312 [Marininema halotolerans]
MVEAQQRPPAASIIGHRVTVIYTTVLGARRVRTGTVVRFGPRVIVLTNGHRFLQAVIPTARLIAVVQLSPLPQGVAPAPAAD